jgi:hypothetical protein
VLISVFPKDKSRDDVDTTLMSILKIYIYYTNSVYLLVETNGVL